MSGKQFVLDRSGAIPRSVIILLLVAVTMVGGFLFAKRNQTVDLTLGGALFPVSADQIDGLLLTKGKLQYRFNRQADNSWSLSGAVEDYLDPGSMRSLIAVLPVAIGGALLPGTENEDRRYDFNGPEALRLRVFLDDGQSLSLAIGALNPVTGNYFASGAGREGCFPVAAPFRDKLFMLPITVQDSRLLPDFDRDLVQNILLTRSGRQYRFTRHQDKWWLLLPDADLAVGLSGLPAQVAAYQALYDDRRRQDDDGVWIMASDQAVGQMIYEVSTVVVREIKPPREAPSWIQQWDLDPPWRQVIMQGPGLNTDPSAPVADQYTLAFGPPVGQSRAPALRRGNVLLVDFEAVNILEEGLDALMEKHALNEVARSADRFSMKREGRVLVEATRTGEAFTDEGRMAWLTVTPAAAEDRYTEKTRHGMSQDLVVNLNRLEVMTVFPPTANAAVLADRERVSIVLNWDEGSEARELVLEAGYLVVDQMPAGSADLARTPDGGPAVGLWFPATGKLLQVSNQLIVTGRSLERVIRP